MRKALEVREGNLLLIDNEIYRVEEVAQKGSAKAHKQIGLKLRSIPEGKFKELTLAPEDKVDEAELIRKKALYSYKDEDFFYFIDAETYDSYSIAKELIGRKECFLKENQEIQIDFFDERPLRVVFPLRIRLNVVSADKGVHGASESSTYKKARLENGLEIDVPQFVEENDVVEVDTESMKYIDRIQEKG